jgi:hypothetical protein
LDLIHQCCVICGEDVDVSTDEFGVSQDAFPVAQQLIHTHHSLFQVELPALSGDDGDVLVSLKQLQLSQDFSPVILCLLQPLLELHILLLFLTELLLHLLVNDVGDVAIVGSAETCLEVSYELDL